MPLLRRRSQLVRSGNSYSCTGDCPSNCSSNCSSNCPSNCSSNCTSNCPSNCPSNCSLNCSLDGCSKDGIILCEIRPCGMTTDLCSSPSIDSTICGKDLCSSNCSTNICTNCALADTCTAEGCSPSVDGYCINCDQGLDLQCGCNAYSCDYVYNDAL